MSETREKAEELARRGRRALARFDVEGYEEAVPLFREAIELEPAMAGAYAGLSETYSYWGFRREINGQESQSLYDMAFDYAAMALELAPGRAECHRAMAVALRRGKKADPDRRRQEVEAAMRLDPEDAQTLCERWRANGYDPDDPSVRAALKIDENLCGLHIDLGAVYCELGRYDEAIGELMRALALSPRNSLALYDLAMVLDRKGLRAEAEQVLERGRRLHPEEPLLEAGLASLER